MIGSLRGIVLSKTPGTLLLDVSGVGYEILTTTVSFERFPAEGQEALVYIVESMAMYGGGVTLYGFLSLEDKEIYLLLKEMPGTGSKKALDYLDKIAKSAPDFRRAILDSDARTLISLFGFTKKTAEKMIVSLKERLAGLRMNGKEKWSPALDGGAYSEALAALIQLGYRESEARETLDRIPAAKRQEASTGDLVKESLKMLNTGSRN